MHDRQGRTRSSQRGVQRGGELRGKAGAGDGLDKKIELTFEDERSVS